MTDIDHLRQWVGRSETVADTIDLATCRRIEATFDLSPQLERGDPLPALWHWCWFHNAARESLLGRDGHAERGGFLPPVPLPRRMWAGGRFVFERPLPIGSQAEKTSTIKSVKMKEGRSGPLCFVTIEHRICREGEASLVEEHDIVFREDPKPGDKPQRAVEASPGKSEFSRTISPTPVMLFRYSALTFNSHRIHYDRDYCREVEGYPGLVFHGPLTATLVANLAEQNCPEKILKEFEYRAVSPVFDTDVMAIEGCIEDGQMALQATKATQLLVMKATARFG